MKALMAFPCVLLLAVNSVQAQFVLLEQDRSVTARGELSFAGSPGGTIHLVDNQSRTADNFHPFDETVTANVENENGGLSAHATAWQQSTLSVTQIAARGGPRDVGACCGGGFADHNGSATSTTHVTFRIDSPTLVHVFAEVLDPPNYQLAGNQFVSGNVSLSIMGPSLSISHLPNSGTVFDGPLSAIPYVFDETRWLQPGEYIVDAMAIYGSGGDVTTYVNVYYDIQLTAMPIPEPIPLVLALFCMCVMLLRRYWSAHLGK
jgi:hypothetical protein